MSKLTVSVNPDVVAPPDTPILRSIRGALKRGSVAAYRKHLRAKYR
jgi:hypothetical protein